MRQERPRVGRLPEATGRSEKQESSRRRDRGSPSAATVVAVEDTVEIDEEGWPDDDTDTDNDMPADAEFFPLDSVSEEHTCPWSFAAGGHDLGASNVQLRNAGGLSILSGRSDGIIRRPVSRRMCGASCRLLSFRAMSNDLFTVWARSRAAGQRSSSVAMGHGLISAPMVGCSACLCG